MKAFKHKDTGRYLAAISHKHKDVETTKMIDDAMKWDVSLKYRRDNYRKFMKKHEDELESFMIVDL